MKPLPMKPLPMKRLPMKLLMKPTDEAATDEAATDEVPDPLADIDPDTIAGAIVANPELTIFAEVMHVTGLLEALNNPDLTPVSVFAPTDEVFFSMLPEDIQFLAENPFYLRLVLRNHVILGSYTLEEMVAAEMIVSDLGSTLPISATDQLIVVNNQVGLLVPGTSANNGILHVVNQLLLPDQETIVAAVEQLQAEEAAIGDPTVDRVSIAEVISSSPDFVMLNVLLEQTELAAMLADEDAEYTLFAPTDAAISQLPADALDALMADPSLIESMLSYHLLEGSFASEAVVTLDAATTLHGSDILIEVDEEGNVTLNGSVNLLLVDVVTSNGIIHIIDAILPPPLTGDADMVDEEDAAAETEAETETETEEGAEEAPSEESSTDE